uniref:Protein ADM2 isoform X2 n=1 Tax=Geotrypetes seraphini TaxID=260995 RepID=A0A6P8S9B4_GEOSA|nr:protein ADM2 isoform X2 [Geotrypetes seraphini]
MSVLMVALACVSLLCLQQLPITQSLPLSPAQRNLQPKSREPPDRALMDGNPKQGPMIHLFKNAWAAMDTRREKTAVHGPRPARQQRQTQSRFRGKRHSHSRTHHHPHLMRVGCVLGTENTNLFWKPVHQSLVLHQNWIRILYL